MSTLRRALVETTPYRESKFGSRADKAPLRGSLLTRVAPTLVGLSAAMERSQIAHVHLFVFASILWAWTKRPIRLEARGVAMIFFTAILVSTVLYGPLVNSKQTGLQFLLLMTCGAIIASNAARREIGTMLDGFLIGVVSGALLACMQYVHLLPLTPFNGEMRPTGFIYSEPDFLGVFSMIALLIIFWRPLPGPLRLLLLGVCASAMVLSASRASWLGAAVGMCVSMLVQWHVNREREQRTKVAAVRWVVALSLVLFAILLGSPPIRASVEARIGSAISGNVMTTSISSQAVVSAQARRNQQATLWELADSAPWYGQGFTASGKVMLFGGLNTGPSVNNVGSDWLLSWWAEGKYLAIPIVLLVFFAAVANLGEVTGILVAGLFVANLFSSTTLFPISAFVIGIALASRRRQARSGHGQGSGDVAEVNLLVTRPRNLGALWG